MWNGVGPLSPRGVPSTGTSRSWPRHIHPLSQHLLVSTPWVPGTISKALGETAAHDAEKDPVGQRRRLEMLRSVKEVIHSVTTMLQLLLVSMAS